MMNTHIGYVCIDFSLYSDFDRVIWLLEKDGLCCHSVCTTFSSACVEFVLWPQSAEKLNAIVKVTRNMSVCTPNSLTDRSSCPHLHPNETCMTQSADHHDMKPSVATAANDSRCCYWNGVGSCSSSRVGYRRVCPCEVPSTGRHLVASNNQTVQSRDSHVMVFVKGM
jgi:hypothetical protein